MQTTDIDHLIETHIVRSEQLRSRALLVTSLLLVVVIMVVGVTPAARPQGAAAGWNSALAMLAGLLIALSSYEVLVLRLLKRWRSRSLGAPVFFRYVNAVIEVLVPTLMIADWSRIAGPVQTLGGVLPWLYFLFIAVSPLHLHPRLCWLVGTASAAGFYIVASSIASNHASSDTALLVSHTSFTLKSLIMIVGGAVAGFVASQLRLNLVDAIRSARERDRAVGIFGQHVSPQVAQRLIDQPSEYRAEQRHVCVLFLDIRGFSTIAAQRTPSAVMDYLNTLFTPMITIVNQHGGIVNKFLGDGFMAIFGAPFEDPELHRNAVHCSLNLLRCVEELNTTGAIPATRIGIGIHAGDAMAGTVGSDERREYTLLGDTVNAAARIEQETKKLGAQIIASDAVMEGLQDERARATELGEISLRGISEPLRLYRLA
ncbi:MAG: adenylate/guanylate cyclase domain-containing protein [Verrucomicrobiaceae bacterium]|nr:adenylate/guanylate cyclase domain-containing protein [Verrucomicrobiaceae bacterium]